MRTLQESRDINAINVLYYPKSVSLLQLWAQLGTWTLCITTLAILYCLQKHKRQRCHLISSVCMNWIGLLIIFVFNSFPHLSPGCGLQVDKRTHLSLHNHTDCQETDGNTIVEDHFFLTGHVTVKTQIKNGGTLGFLFVKAVWSLWELNQLQPAKEKKKNLSHKTVVSFHHFKWWTKGILPAKQKKISLQNLTF